MNAGGRPSVDDLSVLRELEAQCRLRLAFARVRGRLTKTPQGVALAEHHLALAVQLRDLAEQEGR